MVTIFLTVYGKGLRELAEQNLAKAHFAAKELANVEDAKLLFEGAPRFNEFVLKMPEDAASMNTALLEEKIIGGLPLSQWYPELGENASLWCATELTKREEIDHAANVLQAAYAKELVTV